MVFRSKNIAASLNSVRSQLEQRPLEDPVQLWNQLDPQLRTNSFAQCALDQAAHDLWGKKLGKPGLRVVGAHPRELNLLLTTRSALIDTDVMVAKLRELPEWPVYKIKLGTDRDVEIVRALRQATVSRFRVDANCGWQLQETLDNAELLRELNVEFIEQPLPADRWSDMRQARSSCVLPLMADESCITVDDVDRCAGCFHGVNIKLVKCGGPNTGTPHD